VNVVDFAEVAVAPLVTDVGHDVVFTSFASVTDSEVVVVLIAVAVAVANFVVYIAADMTVVAQRTGVACAGFLPDCTRCCVWVGGIGGVVDFPGCGRV
jgi:hypothetical protein